MREYSKISPQFWIGETGKELRKAGTEAQVVSLYLLTNPHANWLGLFYMPLTYIAYETGLPFEGALKGLQRAIEAGFCSYDTPSEMVFVHEMASYQIGEHLEPTDNRCKAIQKEYNELPENPFLPKFYERYSKAFNMSEKRDFKVKKQRGLKGASKPLRSQESESESESESEMESDSFGAPSEPQADEPIKNERKCDPIWDALESRFYKPTTKQSKSEFAGVVKELKAIDCNPDEIRARADRLEKAWGKEKLTIHSLVKHWDKFADTTHNRHGPTIKSKNETTAEEAWKTVLEVLEKHGKAKPVFENPRIESAIRFLWGPIADPMSQEDFEDTKRMFFEEFRKAA